MTRTSLRLVLLVAVPFFMASLFGPPLSGAQPETITFEDIFHLPLNHDSLPPFTWKGVRFSGGALRGNDVMGKWYGTGFRNAIELRFPPGSTGISFDADGYGGSIILFEFMPLQVWSGPVGSGTVLTTIPIPANRVYLPPKNTIEIPDGTTLVSIFTAPPPSGVSIYSNSIAVDNVRYTPGDPDPSFAFDLSSTAQERVLIHNYGSYPYPSMLQTEDRKIQVRGKVTLNGQPAAGKTIHFRLRDPADTAAYVVQAGDQQQDDNVDGPGSLDGGGTTATAVSDGSGNVTVTLQVTDHVSGDNYQVEASTKASFECGSQCPRSAVYTAWKRVYVEVNKMFRRGAYITADVLPGAKLIEVSDVNVFPGAPFQVRLVHAPPVIGGPVAFHFETFTVREVEGRSWLGRGVSPGKLHLDVPPSFPGVQNAYFSGEAVGTNTAPRPYLADAVGLVTGDRAADYFLANATLVNRTFAEAFTEHIWLTDAIAGADADLDFGQPRLFYDGALPYDPMINDVPDGDQSEWMGRKWMRHAARMGQERVAESNHQVVFTAANHPDQYGFCRVGSDYNDLWLFVRQIGNVTRAGESLVHELAHEWRVNGVAHPGVIGQPDGHCNVAFKSVQNMYNRSLKCAMHSLMHGDPNDGEGADGIVGFHYVRVAQTPDSEYLVIRRRSEPVPQNDRQRPLPK